MTWQRALLIVKEHFTVREIAARFGVRENAVWWWIGHTRSHTKHGNPPNEDRRRELVLWALGLLSGEEPRWVTATMPDGTERKELMKILPNTGRCPVDGAKMRRRREILGLTHAELGATIREALGMPPARTRCRVYENYEQGVDRQGHPPPYRMLLMADALYCSNPLQIQPDDISAELEEDRRQREAEDAEEAEFMRQLEEKSIAVAPTIAEDDLPKVIAPSEVERLLNACKLGVRVERRSRAMLECMYLAGLRVSEVCALRPEDVNFTGGFPHLHVEHGKGNRRRNVPIGPRLRQRLMAWDDERDPDVGTFFHTRPGGPVSTRYMRRVVNRLCERAGLDPMKVSPHTLRHCYATERLESDYTVRDVQQLLGHKSLNTTMVYLHVRNQELVTAVNEDPRL
jgi:integrase